MGPIAYSYNPKTFLYSGPVKAQPCKIQIGVFYAPKFSTFDKPPEPVPGRAVAFDDLKKSWIYVAAPKPVEVLKPKDVEKVVEIRENSDLLNQMIANERMILGIELQKKVDNESRRVLSIVEGFDSKISALEVSLTLMRTMIADVTLKLESVSVAVSALDQELENLKPIIDNAAKVAVDADIKTQHAFEFQTRIQAIEKHLDILAVNVGSKSENLISSAAPKKNWKFWS